MVLLHGAGGNAAGALPLLQDLADAPGVLLVAPDSRGATWDLALDGFGRDIAFIDRALRQIFDGFNVDDGRVAIGGFSDGASYALSVGLTNGDLFKAIVACSPGFSAPGERVGRPRIFVSHGARDSVLPIETTSRPIVTQLRSEGYDVTLREFDGDHEVPDDVRREALGWWLD